MRNPREVLERRAKIIAEAKIEKQERTHAQRLVNFLNGKSRFKVDTPYDEQSRRFRDSLEQTLKTFLKSWIESNYRIRSWEHRKTVQEDVQRTRMFLAADELGRPRKMPGFMDMTDGTGDDVGMKEQIEKEQIEADQDDSAALVFGEGDQDEADQDDSALPRIWASQFIYTLLVSSYYDAIRKCKNADCRLYLLRDTDNRAYCCKACRPKLALSAMQRKRLAVRRARVEAIKSAIEELETFPETRRSSLVNIHKSLTHWIAIEASKSLRQQGYPNIKPNSVTGAIKKRDVKAPDWLTRRHVSK